MSEKEIRECVLTYPTIDLREIQLFIRNKYQINISLQKIHDIKATKEAVAWIKREFPTIFAHINDLALFGADSKNVFPIIKNELVKFREMFKDD